MSSEYKFPTPLGTVVNMLDEVMRVGFDEGVVGWGQNGYTTNVGQLRLCIDSDEELEQLAQAIKPNLREWLKKWLEDDTSFRKEMSNDE